MGTDATQLLNAQPTFVPDLVNDYKNRGEPLLGIAWSKAVRIYLDSLTNFDIQTNKTKQVAIEIGRWQERTSRTVVTTYKAEIKITLDEYANLGKVKTTYTKAGVRSLSDIPAAGRSTFFTGGPTMWADGWTPKGYSSSYNATATASPPTTPSYENLFTNNITSGRDSFNALVPLGILLRDKDFADAVFNAFFAGGWIPDQEPARTTTRTYNARNHGGGKYLKWCPGTGLVAASSLGISNGGTAGRGGGAKLDQVHILKDGANPNDNSTNPRGMKVEPKGFYYHRHAPRVTVFCLRKFRSGNSGIESYSWMPTNIDCVAKISARGIVVGLELLFVPDEPVFDRSLDMYTPIYPQDIGIMKPVVFGETSDMQKATYQYQDLGFHLKIDDSSSGHTVNFMINNAGQIKDDFGAAVTYDSSARRNLNTIETTWSDHIKHNKPDTSSNYGAGIFNVHGRFPDRTLGGAGLPYTVQQDIEIINVPGGISPPTSPAIVNVNVEVLNLNAPHPDFPTKSYRVANLSAGSFVNGGWISTGRPDFIKVTSQGGGYFTAAGTSAAGTRVPQSVFNQAYGISDVQVESGSFDVNQGYKPNGRIIFYAWSKFRRGRLLTESGGGAAGLLVTWEAFTAKFEATIDDRGRVVSVEVLDPGYGFDPLLDPDDCSFESAGGLPAFDANLAQALGLIQDTDVGGAPFSFGIDRPSWFFPKSDLVLEARVSGPTQHIKDGSIEKFYVKKAGKGFIHSQSIPEIFPSSSYTPPVFFVDIDSNGKITQIRIDGANTGTGYSPDDLEVIARISAGGAVPGSTVNDESDDPHAWARSIYLNDVPIRDRNDRFNYSKFDFDMRLGNVKNGNGESHLDAAEIQPIDNILIKKEFVLPSYTTIKNYKLFGPRNNGDKDYYFSYTVKNPNVTNISLSIKINKLHYIYEGDQSILYMNLIPIVFAGIGYMVGFSAIKAILARAPVTDPVVAWGIGRGFAGPCGGPVTSFVKVGGFVAVQPSTIPEMAVQLAEKLLLLAGGLIGALIGLLIATLFSCKKIPWLCFKIGELIKNSGEIWPAKMHIAVEYGVEGEEMETKVYQFQGCATSDYVKDILIEKLPSAGGYKNNYKNRIIKVWRLTREMDPVTGGLIESRYQIGAELSGVTEYVEGFFSYPNTAIMGTRVNSKDHPSVPKREYLVKGRRIQIPDNYEPIGGNYVPAVWGGLFKTGKDVQWTSNPSWIIYDLLINQRYGMGKYGVIESDIDKWSFYTFAKRCDEKVDVFIDGESSTERRHMCNLYIDSQKEAYSYINTLLDIYNCSLNFSSGKLYITQDAPKEAVMIFTNSNVSEEGFSYSVVPKTDRITACSVDFVDERDNYMKKTEYVEDPDGVSKYGYSHSNIVGNGITRRGEAHRLAWHKILTRQIENEIITFKAGLESSYLRIGDVIQVVDNKKISSHSGGKISKVVSGTKLEIDIPATYLSNVTSIYIELPAPSDDMSTTLNSSQIANRRAAQYKEYAITGRDGFELTLGSSLDSYIKAGLNWIIKDNAVDKIKPKEYKIEMLKEVSELSYEIIATEYVREKFADIDASSSIRDGTNLDEREYYGHSVIV